MTIKRNVEPRDRERTLGAKLMTSEHSPWPLTSVVSEMVSWPLYSVKQDVDIRTKKLGGR